MSTGDIRNNLDKLRSELKQISCPQELIDALNKDGGTTVSLLPLLHFAMLGSSKLVAQLLLAEGHELHTRSDARFVEGIFKIMRDIFHYQPQLRVEQFFGEGFLERKIMFVYDVVRCAREKHAELHRLQGKKVVVSRHNLQRLAEPSNPKERSRSSEPRDSIAADGSARRSSSTSRPTVTSSSSSSRVQESAVNSISSSKSSARVVRWMNPHTAGDQAPEQRETSSTSSHRPSSAKSSVSSKAGKRGKVRVRSARGMVSGEEEDDTSGVEYGSDSDAMQIHQSAKSVERENASSRGGVVVSSSSQYSGPMIRQVSPSPQPFSTDIPERAWAVRRDQTGEGNTSAPSSVSKSRNATEDLELTRMQQKQQDALVAATGLKKLEDMSDRFRQVVDLMTSKLDTVMERVERLEHSRAGHVRTAGDEETVAAKLVLMESRIKFLEQHVHQQDEEIAQLRAIARGRSSSHVPPSPPDTVHARGTPAAKAVVPEGARGYDRLHDESSSASIVKQQVRGVTGSNAAAMNGSYVSSSSSLASSTLATGQSQSSRVGPHPATAEINDLSAYISSLQARFRETHDLLNHSKSRGIAAS